jgi:hypothetical protein
MSNANANANTKVLSPQNTIFGDIGVKKILCAAWQRLVACRM